MQVQRLHAVAGQETWLLVLETGDEAMDCLRRFAAARPCMCMRCWGVAMAAPWLDTLRKAWCGRRWRWC